MTAVAEGIESAGELEFLRPMAAPSDEGFCLGRRRPRRSRARRAPSRLMAPITG